MTIASEHDDIAYFINFVLEVVKTIDRAKINPIIGTENVWCRVAAILNGNYTDEILQAQISYSVEKGREKETAGLRKLTVE